MIIQYAIELDISDITSDTNANIGLYSGIFRWVTGRPNYDGATVVPTDYDSDPGFSTIWKEGIIKRDSIGASIRMVDILSSGDYGTLSGFTFSIDNSSVDGSGTGDKFSDVITDNDYYLINRKVKKYIVIDDVFYSIWQGVVSKTGNTELDFMFTCSDDFKNVHKVIPPNIADDKQFKDIISKSDGKTIPVCFGNVSHAKLLNIYSKTNTQRLFFYRKYYNIAPIIDYNASTKTVTVDILYYSGLLENQFAGMFLKHTIDGDDQIVKILYNSAALPSPRTLGYTYEVDILIEYPLTSEPVLYFDVLSTADAKASWVEIYDFKSSYVVSNDSVTEFPESENGDIVTMYYFDKDNETYKEVSELINNKYPTNLIAGYPGVEVLSGIEDLEGNYSSFYTIKSDYVSYNSSLIDAAKHTITTNEISSGDNPELRDRDYDTSLDYVVRGTSTTGNSLNVQIDIEIPPNLNKSDFENLYLVIDFDAELSVDSSSALISIGGSPRDIYYKPAKSVVINATYYSGTMSAGVPKTFETIPKSYYNETTGNTSLFLSIKDDLDLSSWYENVTDTRAYPTVRMALGFVITAASQPWDLTVTFREIAFAGVKVINVVDDNLYIKTKGEQISGEETNNVYNIFRSIIQTYDGLSDYDYGNLPTTRQNWIAGRQITERKSSYEYLRELARQSFVGIYPTRLGKRGFKAFRDDTTFTLTFNTTNILKGSIKNFGKTDINEVYNEFYIQYEWNPGSESFDKSVYVKKVDESAFPGRFVSTSGSDTNRTFSTGTITVNSDGSSFITLTFGSDPTWASVGNYLSVDDSSGVGSIEFAEIIFKDSTTVQATFLNLAGILSGATTTTTTAIDHASGVPKWKTFVGGFNSYNKSETLWDTCHESYLRAGVVRPLPDDLSKCYFYIEQSNFDTGNPGDNGTPHKYLERLVEWTTRQKEVVEFAVSLNSTNVLIEPLTNIIFSDPKFTGGDNRQGYLSKVKCELDGVVFEAVLEPADIISVTDCTWIETGFGTSNTESGSEADEVTETGTC